VTKPHPGNDHPCVLEPSTLPSVDTTTPDRSVYEVDCIKLVKEKRGDWSNKVRRVRRT
jgi:hypothetical protein